MKRIFAAICLFLMAASLFACAAPAETGTTPTPTTTAAPTETEKTYPEPDKLIALTFDDGPNAHMGTILDVLAQYDAKASFFVIGRKIGGAEDYISQAYTEGHEIGNHSFSHEKMTEKTDEQILEEVSKVQTAVADITGEAPIWYRAPFLAANKLTYDLIDMPYAGCGVSAGDGSNDNLAEDRIYRVTSGAYDGAIVLLHCNDITAEVLPQILEELKMQGYEMVTISELFTRTGVTPDITAEFQYKDVTTAE